MIRFDIFQLMRHDRSELAGRIFFGILVVAIGVTLAQGVFEVVQAVREEPLIFAGSLGVAVAGMLTVHLIFRAGRSIRATDFPAASVSSAAFPGAAPRRGAATFPGASASSGAVPRLVLPDRPSRVPDRVRDLPLLILCLALFGGGGVFLISEGVTSGYFGVAPILFGVLNLCLAAGCAAAFLDRTPAPSPPPRPMLTSFTAAPIRPDPGNARLLLTQLARLEPDEARTALTELSASPYLLDGLFHHARRGDLAEQLRLYTETATPLAWALASIDRDGYTRADAVRAMAGSPIPEFVPFLVERAVDPTEPVRTAASTALQALLTSDPGTYREPLSRALPRIERRDHAPAVLALMATAP